MNSDNIMKFSFIVTYSDYIVRDHRIGEIRAVAGVTYLEPIYSFLVSKGYSIESIEVSNMIFLNPVTPTENTDMKVEVLFEKKNNMWDVEAFSYPIENNVNNKEEKQQVFQCKVNLDSEPLNLNKTIDIELMKNSAEVVVDFEEAYKVVRQGGIFHYEFMKLSGEGYIIGNDILAKVSLSELAKSHRDYFNLHPAYIDGATVVSGLLFYNQTFDDNDTAFLPMFVGKFRAFEKMNHDSIYVYVKRGDMSTAKQDMLYNNIEIYDVDGNLIGMYDRFGTKKIRTVENSHDRSETIDSISHETYVQDDKYDVNTLLLNMVNDIHGKVLDEEEKDMTFYELGFNSTDLIGLVSQLEMQLDIELYPTLLFEYNTFNLLSGYFTTEYNDIKIKIPDKQVIEKTSINEDNTILDKYYTCEWTPARLMQKESVIDTNDNILIIYPSEMTTYVEKFSNVLQNSEVYLLGMGKTHIQHSSRHWDIEIESIEQINNYIKEIDRIDDVYFFNGIITKEMLAYSNNHNFYDEIENKGIISLFRLMKAMESSELLYNVKSFNILTNNIYGILDEETIPYFATLNGFIRSVSKEYPKINFTCIDIDLLSNTHETAEHNIFNYISNYKYQSGETIALRRGKAYTLKPKKVILPKSYVTTFENEGVYVIIGGSGGIGTALSKYIAKKVQGTIIWIGRSKLNISIESKMIEIEKLGGKIAYIQGDATDKESLSVCIEDIIKTYGNINGIIHSALVLRDIVLKSMTEEDLREVLQSKTTSSLVLVDVVKELSLDFLLFFSSIQSLLGNIGQSNYAAGSTFQDAYIQSIIGKMPFDVKVINWGYWGEVGVAANNEFKQKMIEAGVIPIRVDEGIETLERLLASTYNQLYTFNFKKSVLNEFGIPTSLNTKRILHIEDEKSIGNMKKYWSAIKEGNGIEDESLDINKAYLDIQLKNNITLSHFLMDTTSAKEMEVVICGRGENVLLINGFGLTGAQWVNQIQEMCHKYRFISINIPGVGLSIGDCDVDFSTLSDVFVEILEELGIEEPVHVIGSSFGGMLAQSIAYEYPEKVKSLILVDSSLSIELDLIEIPIKDRMRNDFKHSGYENEFSRVLDSECTNAQIINYVSYNKQGFGVDNKRQIICPTLLIHGSLDTIFNDEDRNKLKESIQNSVTHVIEGAGHLPNITHPLVFNEVIVDFLK